MLKRKGTSIERYRGLVELEGLLAEVASLVLGVRLRACLNGEELPYRAQPGSLYFGFGGSEFALAIAGVEGEINTWSKALGFMGLISVSSAIDRIERHLRAHQAGVIAGLQLIPAFSRKTPELAYRYELLDGGRRQGQALYAQVAVTEGSAA